MIIDINRSMILSFMLCFKLKALQAAIMKVVEKEPYWGEKIPLRWLQFEEKKEAERDKMMRMDEVQLYLPK